MIPNPLANKLLAGVLTASALFKVDYYYRIKCCCIKNNDFPATLEGVSFTANLPKDLVEKAEKKIQQAKDMIAKLDIAVSGAYGAVENPSDFINSLTQAATGVNADLSRIFTGEEVTLWSRTGQKTPLPIVEAIYQTSSSENRGQAQLGS